MKKKVCCLVVLLMCVLFFGTSCESIHSAYRAAPVEPTEFLPEHEKLIRAPDSFPFHYVWAVELEEIRDAKYVRIAPVNMSFLSMNSTWDKINMSIGGGMQKNLDELAQFMHDQIVLEFKKYEQQGLCIVTDDPNEKDCYIVETAIVAIVPTEATMNALGEVAGIFVPGASMVAGMLSQGSIVIEVRTRDAMTGRIIAMGSTRETDPEAILSLAKYTWLSSARSNIKMVARMIAKCFYANDMRNVKRDFPVHLFAD